MANTPTGYKPGRPRTGEVRPLTIGSLYSTKCRQKKSKEDPVAYYIHQRIYAQLYYLANKDRIQSLAKAGRQRKVLRNDPNAIFLVG